STSGEQTVRAVRAGRRRALCLPDLLRGTQARQRRADREREARRSHAAVGVHRRRRHRLLLLTMAYDRQMTQGPRAGAVAAANEEAVRAWDTVLYERWKSNRTVFVDALTQVTEEV